LTRVLAAGSRRWLAVAVALALAALLGAVLVPGVIAATGLDWQPALAAREPWRALSAVAVHYSALHLAANLAGLALVLALGVAAHVPRASATAWAAAIPLTQIGLALRPDLQHYGGLSGALHAGAAVVAVHLVLDTGPGPRRWIGVGLLIGLVAKVVDEAPWGPALRHPAGWDIATAPFAHASGLVAGLVCASMAVAMRRMRRGPALAEAHRSLP
jgi:rhomboid family GlyGly-CTERM serine protease